MIKNKPYDKVARAKELEELADRAWMAVAEFHNQTEIASPEKKKLLKILNELDKQRAMFLRWQK